MSHKSIRPRRKRGGGHDEEHVNHERWLVTYADMLTLLMVLFIVLFAMSQVDQKKFAALAYGLSTGFGSKSAAFSGETAPLDGSGNDASVIPLDPGVDPGVSNAVSGQVSGTGSGANGSSADGGAQADQAVAADQRATAMANAKAAEQEANNLRQIQEQITNALKAQKLLGSVQFAINQRGLVVTVVTSEVVFAGDRADLLTPGQKILNAIVPSLIPLPNSIEVDGNTNQLPVPTVNYPSAWELSTARASAVVRYMISHGMTAGRLSAVGFADTHPLIPPSDPRSVTMNRRVDIVVLSTQSADVRELLPSAAG